MAYSKVTYTGDGSTTTFSVPFPFIAREHVTVQVNGVSVNPSWITDGLLQLTAAPPVGSTIVISRNSQRQSPIVDFQDAQVLTEADLDLANLQSIYVAQEAFDLVDTVTVTTQVAADAAAAATSALNAANSATSAAASAVSAANDATAAATSASDAALSAAAVTNVWRLNTANTVTSAQRANIDPNVTYDLASASLSATFFVAPGSVLNVPAGKMVTAFRTEGTFKLAAGAAFTPHSVDIATDATSDVTSSLYGHKAKVTAGASGSVYGAYFEAGVPAGNTISSVFAYPLYLRINADGDPLVTGVNGSAMTLDIQGQQFQGVGLEVRGGAGSALGNAIYIGPTMKINVSAIRYATDSTNAANFLEHIVVTSGTPKTVFMVDQTGTVLAPIKDTGGETVHVETFGAKGDGTTDDTAAIQAAFNAGIVVAFRQGATYKVTDTLYLSHPAFTTSVKKIIGNGATLSFSGFTRLCSDDLTTAVFGVCGASPTTTGTYGGWQGVIDGLRFSTAQKIVMLGGCGNLFRLHRCEFVATGAGVKGAILLRNNINTHIDGCLVDMRACCTDTTGTGTFNTTAGGTNIPSSFGIFFHRLLPAQVDSLGRGITDASASGFNDPYQITNCVIVGGQTGLADGGSDSHTYRMIRGNEFAYQHYGIITNASGAIADNWFENHKYACIRTVAGGPPWWAGAVGQPLQVSRNSFSPHNAATALLLDNIADDSLFTGNNYGDPVAGGTYVNVGASSRGNRAYWLHNTNSNGGTITGLSATSPHTAFTIVGGSATEQHVNAVAVAAPAASAWSFNGPGTATPVALANGATMDFPAGGGMIVLKVSETGNTGAFLVGGASVALLGQTAGAEFVALAANTAPAAGKIGIYYNGASSSYRLHNNVGATRTVGLVTMRASAAN